MNLDTQLSHENASIFFKMSNDDFNTARSIAIRTNNQVAFLQIDLCRENYLDEESPLEISHQSKSANQFENLISRSKKLNCDLGNYYFSYCMALFGQNEFEKAVEVELQAEKYFAKVIKTLKTEEEIISRRDRNGSDKGCNKLLQLCYVTILKSSPDKALLVAERGKTRYFADGIISNEPSEVKLTIEKIKEIATNIDSFIMVLSETIPLILCWIIFPDKNVPVKFLAFTNNAELLLSKTNETQNFEPISIENIHARVHSTTTIRYVARSGQVI